MGSGFVTTVREMYGLWCVGTLSDKLLDFLREGAKLTRKEMLSK